MADLFEFLDAVELGETASRYAGAGISRSQAATLEPPAVAALGIPAAVLAADAVDPESRFRSTCAVCGGKAAAHFLGDFGTGSAYLRACARHAATPQADLVAAERRRRGLAAPYGLREIPPPEGPDAGQDATTDRPGPPEAAGNPPPDAGNGPPGVAELEAAPLGTGPADERQAANTAPGRVDGRLCPWCAPGNHAGRIPGDCPACSRPFAIPCESCHAGPGFYSSSRIAGYYDNRRPRFAKLCGLCWVVEVGRDQADRGVTLEEMEAARTASAVPWWSEHKRDAWSLEAARFGCAVGGLCFQFGTGPVETWWTAREVLKEGGVSSVAAFIAIDDAALVDRLLRKLRERIEKKGKAR